MPGLYRYACNMIRGHHRIASIVVAITASGAALWLLLFAGPWLLNAHQDGAALLALCLYLGIPAVAAWGGTRLWHFLALKDDSDDD